MQYRYAVAIISTVVMFSCSGGRKYVPENEYKLLHTISASDGIDKREALIIAKTYFLSHISGCGYADTPALRDEKWISNTRIGYAGYAGSPIVIDKLSGDLSFSDNEPIRLERLKKIIFPITD